jgi:competence ComEA-like helix-hairpin-helix protein
MLSIGAAFAAVDVNTADQAALESVKGLGPVKSKAIIDERAKNGPYKDADDLAARVKGLGTKSVAKLEEAGLTIGGSSVPPTAKPTAKPSTAATPPAATTATAGTASAASGTKATKTSKKASADAASGASETKPSKSKSKKDKAASAAAASQ